MTRACIVTIDAARARIFLYNDQAKPGFEIVEYKDLDNPGRRLKVGEMFSETRPTLAQNGGDHSTFGEPGAPYDDHRDAHIDMMDIKFTRHAFDTLEVILREKQIAHLIVCAAPRMMGVVRAEGGGVLRRAELRVDEVTSNLSTLTEAALHDHLAQRGLIPPRARLAIAR
jgi:protein required for attachment to host cells